MATEAAPTFIETFLVEAGLIQVDLEPTGSHLSTLSSRLSLLELLVRALPESTSSSSPTAAGPLLLIAGEHDTAPATWTGSGQALDRLWTGCGNAVDRLFAVTRSMYSSFSPVYS